MNFILSKFKWIMLLSGALTATMFYGLIAPQAALESMFGVSFTGHLESIIIRSWSSLVGLIGIILIYGALNERHRVFSASIAALSKAIFVSLVIIYGQAFLSQAALAVAIDLAVIMCTVIFLIAVKVQRAAG
jgi:hypothetical protein